MAYRNAPFKKALIPDRTPSDDTPSPALYSAQDHHLDNDTHRAAQSASPWARGPSERAADLDAGKLSPAVTEGAATSAKFGADGPSHAGAKPWGVSSREPDPSHIPSFDVGETSSSSFSGRNPMPGTDHEPWPWAADAAASNAIDNLVSGCRMLGRSMQKKADTTADLTLSLQGEADAVGIDTNASGDMFARVMDKGAVSVAYGYSTFSALAEATDGELAFASAFSDAFASGADFIISWTRHLSISLQSDDGQFAKEVSSTFVVAIDFEAWDLRKGPITIDGDSDRSFFGELDILPDLIAAGNIATFEFDVEAIGENTFADVAFSVLSVEDRLSSVAATADLGIA